MQICAIRKRERYVHNADFEDSYQITIAEKARAALQQQVQRLETKLTELAPTESTPTTPTQSASKHLAAPAHPPDPVLANCGCVLVAEMVEIDRILGEVTYLARQGFCTLTDTQHEMEELNRYCFVCVVCCVLCVVLCVACCVLRVVCCVLSCVCVCARVRACLLVSLSLSLSLFE